MKCKVTCKCEQGHESSFTTDGMSLEYVKVMAGLLDGSSDHYVYKPREHPVSGGTIGKCEICGTWFSATVEELKDES
jgi:hypothetical protein